MKFQVLVIAILFSVTYGQEDEQNCYKYGELFDDSQTLGDVFHGCKLAGQKSAASLLNGECALDHLGFYKADHESLDYDIIEAAIDKYKTSEKPAELFQECKDLWPWTFYTCMLEGYQKICKNDIIFNFNDGETF